MRVNVATIAFAALMLQVVCCPGAEAALDSSAYLFLNQDREICNTITLLSHTITLGEQDVLLIESDGRYFPEGSSAANLHIVVDGQSASSDAFIDWRNSSNPQQHSFNIVGAVALAAGVHRIELIAEYISGCYVVGTSSNLSIVVHPAEAVDAQILESDTQPFLFVTSSYDKGMPAPFSTLLMHSISLSGSEDVVALAAGRSYQWGHDGDSMWGIYLDSVNVGNHTSLWAVNDLCTCAETQAPMFTHAFYPDVSGRHTISLGASEFPWHDYQDHGEDPVIYRVGSGARLVTLTGNMTVRGSAAQSEEANYWWDWIEIGSRLGNAGEIPVGTNVLLATGTLWVPIEHNGVVMFMAKSRVQGDAADLGGTVSLWLEIDGIRVGSTGVQQLKHPNGDSQRTISASYLAAGTQALLSGAHTVKVYGRADGCFLHLSMVQDLPLIWFD